MTKWWPMTGVGLVLGVFVAAFVTSSPPLIIGVALANAVLTYVTRSSIIPLLVAVPSLAFVGAISYSVLINGTVTEIPLVVFVSAFITTFSVGFVLASRVKLARGALTDIHVNIWSLVLTGVWLILTMPSRNNPVFYAFLMGEDNGSIYDVAHSLLRDRSISVSSIDNSGWFSGIVLAAVSVTTSLGSQDVVSLQSVDVVTRAYAAVAGSFAIGSTIIFMRLMTAHGRSFRKRGLTAVFGFLATTPWAMAATYWGHFGALVALLTVGFTAFTATTLPNSSLLGLRRVHVVAMLLGSLAIGGSWYPLLPLSLWLFFGLLIIVTFSALRQLMNRDVRLVYLVVATVVAVAVVAVMYGQSFAHLLDLENILRISKYSGGVSRIGSTIVIFTVVGVLIQAFRIAQPALTFTVISLVAAVLGAITLNYFQGLQSPEYGAAKLTGIVVGALFVFALPPVFGLFQSVLRNGYGNFVMPALIVFGLFVFSVSPLYDLGRFIVAQPSSSAYLGPQRALTEENRTVVCIATSKGYEYQQYKCSRVLLGAQGKHNSEYRVFMAGNLCSVASEHLHEMEPDKLKRLTVIVSDPSQLSSVDDCQARGWAGSGLLKNDKYLTGWTSAIPWGSVKIYDFEGNVVTPSFDYLRKYDDYSDEDIQLLTATLSK
jgi:hypothetical protein